MGEHVIKELLSHFDALYQARWNFKYLFSGKDAKLMKDLLGIYQPEDIKRFMSAFFESHDDFIASSGFSLSVFRACLPKVIASVATKTARERPEWQCPHVERCGSHWTCDTLLQLDPSGRKYLTRAESKLRMAR